MSDAGDDIQVENAPVEVTSEAPKGKMSVEDALQVSFLGQSYILRESSDLNLYDVISKF